MSPRIVLGVAVAVCAAFLLVNCGGLTTAANTARFASIRITTASIPAGTETAAYSFALTAQGGLTPYNWLVTSGTLPAGLQLGSATGIISGTPSQAGQQTVNIEVIDSRNRRATQTFTISIAAATGPLAITSTSAPAGTVGVAYSFGLMAWGGTTPYTWKVTSGGLPAGLQLNGATGVIAGTPSTAGTQTVGVSVQDATQQSASATLTFSIVSGTAPLSVTTTAIPAATVNTSYRFTLAAQGGVLPYTWRILSGTLPANLTFNSTTGTIAGTPTAAASQGVDFEVIDAAQATASQSLTVIVNPNTSSFVSYYIDSTAGNDSNNGTSMSTPWRTVAKVNSTSFAPGDHIFFLRGDTWRETLSFSSAGAAGNPIVLDAYGSGPAPILSGGDLVAQTAWAACTSCQSGVWRASVAAQPNIVIFNGALGNRKTATSSLAAAKDWYWASGVLYVWCTMNPGAFYVSPGVEAGSRGIVADLSAAAYVTLQNLDLTAANALPTNGVIYAHMQNGVAPHDLILNSLALSNGYGHGVHLEDCNNCTIQGSTISGVGSDGISLVSLQAQPITSAFIVGNTVTTSHHDGIATYGCAIGGNCQGLTLANGVFLSGVVISGNTVHDNGEGIYLQWTNNSSVTANTVYHNTDTTDPAAEGGGIELEASSSNTIEKNLVYTNLKNGIELSNDSGAGTALTGASSNVIRYNAFHDNGAHGLFTNAAPTQSNQFLYNLVWNHVNGECIIADGVGHAFYGNMCWNNSTGIDLFTSSSTPTTGNITFKNNIIANSITRAVHIESGVNTSTLVFDNNDYDFGSGGEFLQFSTAYTLSGWQAATGLDSHSFAANPLFVSSTPSAPTDFVLQSTSPNVGGGAALSSSFALGLAGSSIWPAGVTTVSQPAAWVIGAFVAP